MEMPGRKYTAQNYRYGFNGVEKDDEHTGASGNIYNTYYREYDARLGRWFARDPITISSESPYAGIGNNPITFNDPMGDRIKYGSLKNFIRITYLRLTKPGINTHFKSLKEKYGMGGKSKKDLNIRISSDTKETLAEAVDHESTDPGACSTDDQDYLKYNGNIDAKNEPIREENTARIPVKSSPGQIGDNILRLAFKLNSNILNNFDKWTVDIRPKNPVELGLIPSWNIIKEELNKPNATIYFAIINQNKDHEMGNDMKINGNQVIKPDWTSDHQNNPLDQVVEYRIMAFSQTRIYRVEKRSLFGWDYKNRELTLSPATRSKLKTISGKINWEPVKK